MTKPYNETMRRRDGAPGPEKRRRIREGRAHGGRYMLDDSRQARHGNARVIFAAAAATGALALGLGMGLGLAGCGASWLKSQTATDQPSGTPLIELPTAQAFPQVSLEAPPATVRVQGLIQPPAPSAYDASIKHGARQLGVTGFSDEVIQDALSKLDADAKAKRNYHFAQLKTKEERFVYAAIFAMVSQMNREFALTGPGLESLHNYHDVLLFVTMDYPELFWYDYRIALLETEVTILTENSFSEVMFTIDYGPWTREKAEKTADDLTLAAYRDLAHVRPDDDLLQRAYELYEYLPTRIAYGGEDQSCVSAALGDHAICSGFALWYQLLCKMMEVPAYYNPCEVKGANPDESHVTTVLEYEPGKYTMVDQTWGRVMLAATHDVRSTNRYFGFGDEFYQERYNPGDAFTFGGYTYKTPPLTSVQARLGLEIPEATSLAMQ